MHVLAYPLLPIQLRAHPPCRASATVEAPGGWAPSGQVLKGRGNSAEQRQAQMFPLIACLHGAALNKA